MSTTPALGARSWLTCTRCQTTRQVDVVTVCECGGLLEVSYDWDQLHSWHPTLPGPTRYDALLPVSGFGAHRVSLGEGGTPLLDAGDCHLKCDFLMPTGSYKDRIAAIAMTIGRASGATAWIGTSSGNAGAAFAAYGARAGLTGTLLVVPTIPREKLNQLRVYGPSIYGVENFGFSPEVEAEVFSLVHAVAIKRGMVLGITARTFNAAAMEGAKTIAYEIAEQLGRVPNAVFVPTGGGGLLTSIWRGFADWVRVGLATGVPAMVAVQPSGCNPIARAIEAGKASVDPLAACTSAISGLQLTAPPDGDRAVAAVRDSGGFAVSVTDEQAFAAQRLLAREHGVFVEPAGAAAYAGYLASPTPNSVIVLTGSGLKTSIARSDNDLRVLSTSDLRGPSSIQWVGSGVEE